MSPAPTKTGSVAGEGVDVAPGVGAIVALGGTVGVALGAGAGVGVGAIVGLGGALGRALGAGSAAAVGREALGVLASGCPQPAAAIASASVDKVASSRRVWIGMPCIVVPCDRIALAIL